MKLLSVVVQSVVAAAVLCAIGGLAFLMLAQPLFSQPPKKIYTGTQWTLKSLAEAAGAYRSAYGTWPVDDRDSTFLYKLMGGGTRRPLLTYHDRPNVYRTCQVFGMTSPAHSPWAAGPKGSAAQGPYHIPVSDIPWPKEHDMRATPFGGSGAMDEDNWDKVPRDPKICPWLATDVVGYDGMGGRFHGRMSFSNYEVYSEGLNREDNGGWWDDLRPGLTLGMIARYHPEYFVLLLVIAAAAIGLYYVHVVRRLWRREPATAT